jgi:hypothetical protein
MADFRFVKCQYWVDPYTAKLTPVESYLYLWLFTNPHVNQVGMIDISEGTMLAETRLKETDLRSGLDRFESDGKIRQHGGVIWVVNFHKHQSTRSPKLRQRIAKDLEALGSHPFAQAFIDRYPDALGESQPPELEMIEKGNKGREIRKVSNTVSNTLSGTVSSSPQNHSPNGDGLLPIPKKYEKSKIGDDLARDRADIMELQRLVNQGRSFTSEGRISQKSVDRAKSRFNQAIRDLT